jgi:hypothetical protein
VCNLNIPMKRDDKRESLFLIGYVLIISLVILYLFRSFVFSSGMLFSGDVIIGGVTFRSFIRQAITSTGSVPLWNPLQCCGIPFIDAIHGGAFYPLTYLEIISNVFRDFGYSFMLHYLLAATFAYWSARQFGLSKLAASLVGVSYGLSPCLVSWVAPGHDGKIYVATWFPLIVGLAERIFLYGKLADTAWLGLVIGITILTPHLQLTYYVLWFLLVFSLFRCADLLKGNHGSRDKKIFRNLIFIGFGVSIGLLISSVQILPSANYILYNTDRATVSKGVEFAGQYSLHAEEIISLAIPEFSGTNEQNGPWLYWGKNKSKNNSEAVSALGIYLALLTFVLPGQKYKYFWGLCAVVVLLYALGNATPLFRLLLSVIPVLSSMEAPSGATFIAVFAISILAGMAIDGIRTMSKLTGFRYKLAITVIIIPPFVLLLATLLMYFDAEHILVQYANVFYRDLLTSGSGESVAWIRAKANIPNLITGLFIAASTLTISSVIIMMVSARKKWMALLWVVPILIVFVSVRFNERFIYIFNQDDVFGLTEIKKVLKDQTGYLRTIEYDIYESNLQLAYAGIPSPIGIQDRIPLSYFELMGGGSRRNIHNPRFINLTGTRYLVASPESQISPYALGVERLDTIVNNGKQILLENRNCFPRVFLVNSFQVISDRRILIDSVLNGSIDLHRTILLEEDPRFQASKDIIPVGETSIGYYGNDSISITVNSPCNSFLVLTDNFNSSWKAFSDGKELKVYRADGAFRAVEVSSGTKNIAFVFRSIWVRIGKVLSSLGLILVAIVLVRQWVNRQHCKSEP